MMPEVCFRIVWGQISFVDGADRPCVDGCWAWDVAAWRREGAEVTLVCSFRVLEVKVQKKPKKKMEGWLPSWDVHYLQVHHLDCVDSSQSMFFAYCPWDLCLLDNIYFRTFFFLFWHKNFLCEFFSLGSPQIAPSSPLFPGRFYCGGYHNHCHYCFVILLLCTGNYWVCVRSTSSGGGRHTSCGSCLWFEDIWRHWPNDRA